MTQKGYLAILPLALIVSALILGLLFYRGFLKFPSSINSKPAATVIPQVQYSNPFDKTTQYTNPFSTYKNPFDNLK